MKARLHLLSTVSALALAGTAFAADMPVKAPPPVVVVAPSWTGFYIGGHGVSAGCGTSRPSPRALAMSAR